MQGLGLISLRRARRISFIILSILGLGVFCAQTFAAPRRPAAVLTEFKKPEKKKKVFRESEVDFRLGNVIWKQDKLVAVYLLSTSRSMPPGWGSVFYVCDERMTPVATVVELGVSHRNCSMFLISEGEVELGDNVFVKYIPPELPQNSQDGREAKL